MSHRVLPDGSSRLRLSRISNDTYSPCFYFAGKRVRVALEGRSGLLLASTEVSLSRFRVRTYEVQAGDLRLAVSENESREVSRALSKHVTVADKGAST